MKELTVIEKSGRPSIELLNQYEEEIGAALPLDFRMFLMDYNPIEIRERGMTIEGKLLSMDRFFPFEDTNELSLRSTNETLKDFFEGKYLTFGCDSGGWQYVISIQESDYGKVYFCRMDEDLGEGFTLLADTFEEFIERLEVAG